MKRGGSPVDIRESIVDIVRRMDLSDDIRAISLTPKRTEFRSADDSILASMGREGDQPPVDEYEIERTLFWT